MICKPIQKSYNSQDKSASRFVVIPDPLQKYMALGNILADSAAKSCRSEANTKDTHKDMCNRRREEEKMLQQLCQMLVDCNL